MTRIVQVGTRRSERLQGKVKSAKGATNDEDNSGTARDQVSGAVLGRKVVNRRGKGILQLSEFPVDILFEVFHALHAKPSF
jgi:hypothetical protein